MEVSDITKRGVREVRPKHGKPRSQIVEHASHQVEPTEQVQITEVFRWVEARHPLTPTLVPHVCKTHLGSRHFATTTGFVLHHAFVTRTNFVFGHPSRIPRSAVAMSDAPPCVEILLQCMGCVKSKIS